MTEPSEKVKKPFTSTTNHTKSSYEKRTSFTFASLDTRSLHRILLLQLLASAATLRQHKTAISRVQNTSVRFDPQLYCSEKGSSFSLRLSRNFANHQNTASSTNYTYTTTTTAPPDRASMSISIPTSQLLLLLV